MVFRNICAETFQNHVHIEAETTDPAWQGILKEVRAVTWGSAGCPWKPVRLSIFVESSHVELVAFPFAKPRSWSILDQSIGSPWSFPQLKLCKLWQLLFHLQFEHTGLKAIGWPTCAHRMTSNKMIGFLKSLATVSSHFGSCKHKHVNLNHRWWPSKPSHVLLVGAPTMLQKTSVLPGSIGNLPTQKSSALLQVQSTIKHQISD